MLFLFIADRKKFLGTWQEIPTTNEVQNNITVKDLNSGKRD